MSFQSWLASSARWRTSCLASKWDKLWDIQLVVSCWLAQSQWPRERGRKAKKSTSFWQWKLQWIVLQTCDHHHFGFEAAGQVFICGKMTLGCTFTWPINHPWLIWHTMSGTRINSTPHGNPPSPRNHYARIVTRLSCIGWWLYRSITADVCVWMLNIWNLRSGAGCIDCQGLSEVGWWLKLPAIIYCRILGELVVNRQRRQNKSSLKHPWTFWKIASQTVQENPLVHLNTASPNRFFPSDFLSRVLTEMKTY